MIHTTKRIEHLAPKKGGAPDIAPPKTEEALRVMPKAKLLEYAESIGKTVSKSKTVSEIIDIILDRPQRLTLPPLKGGE